MDRSDLDSFQNITNPNEKKSARNSFGTNQQSNANIPSNSSQNQQNNQAYYHHQQQQLHQQPQHQVCQICGVFLKIDSNILNMSEPTYKQLAMQFNYRDDFETTLCSGAGAMADNFSGSGLGGVMGATSLDTDMELSLNANLISSGTSQTGGGGALTATGGSSQEKSTTALEEQPLYRKSITPYMFDAGLVVESTTTGGAQSTLLMTGQHDMLTGWSARINETTALFDMMSSNTAIDHPLCEECADLLVNQLDAQCKIVENEYTEYMQLIGRLNAQVNSESEIAELEKELDALEVEERDLLNKIQDAEKEKEKQEKEKEERLAEEVSLLQQEQTYLLEYSNFKRQLIKLEEKQESLDNQLQNTKFHFNRLRTVNVLNAAFHIWHSGPFGTINFFRLGRLPGIQVEWDEINAGLGQANLLLYCLANRMGLEFKRYRLVPNGSYSSIEVVETASGHDTKSGDELNMYRIKGYKYYFDWDKKFEKGMTAFLDCLKQLEEKITSQDNEFSLPYKINQHKLEDKNGSSYSIKFQLNSFEEWTKALKYMLTNLKWSLAWVISNENS